MGRFLLIASLLLAAVFSAEAVVRPYCVICRRQVPQRYLKGSDNKVYCSKTCFEKTLPRCVKCGLICRGESFHTEKGFFCSKKCVDSMHLPHCNRCRKTFREGRKLPTAYGEFYYCVPCSQFAGCLICERPGKNMRKLDNGNYLCRDCDKDVINSLPQLQRLFNQVRSTLTTRLNFRNDHKIKLVMRSFGQNRNVRLDRPREFGLYRYRGKEITTKPLPFDFWRDKKTSVRYEDESCTIEVMDSLPAIKAAEVIAHELAHDYMKHRWYYIKDDKLREGFAELAAAEYNRMTGNEKWNYRMDINPDKIYGDGYRMMKSYLDKEGWDGVCRRLDEANRRAYPHK